MKTIIYFTFSFQLFASVTYSQSVVNFQSGTAIEVQTGASICADSVIMNGTFTGGGTICGLLYTLNLTCIIQGFYNPVTDLMVIDTARVYLRNSTSPYELVDSAKAVLDSLGAGTFNFSFAVNGMNYYLAVRHRNSIETWSKNAQAFGNNSLAYNFFTANTQAYGNNMKQIDTSPLRYGIYSGDENQDGFVNLTDVVKVFNNANSFVNGYVASDMNGDNITDLTDIVITFNNASSFVSTVKP